MRARFLPEAFFLIFIILITLGIIPNSTINQPDLKGMEEVHAKKEVMTYQSCPTQTVTTTIHGRATLTVPSLSTKYDNQLIYQHQVLDVDVPVTRTKYRVRYETVWGPITPYIIMRREPMQTYTTVSRTYVATTITTIVTRTYERWYSTTITISRNSILTLTRTSCYSYTSEVEVGGDGGPFDCFIASASFGSALTPEVQFLRTFRDSRVLSTFAGSQFMLVFNAVYYSFSPTVAHFISQNPLIRMVMRGTLYPLLGILHVSSHVYSLFNINLEYAVIMAGLVACLLIGSVYLAPLIAASSIILRRKRKGVNFEKKALLYNTVILLGSGFLILLGEIFKISQIMSVGTATFAISTLFIPSFITIWLINRYKVKGC